MNMAIRATSMVMNEMHRKGTEIPDRNNIDPYRSRKESSFSGGGILFDSIV